MNPPVPVPYSPVSGPPYDIYCLAFDGAMTGLLNSVRAETSLNLATYTYFTQVARAYAIAWDEAFDSTAALDEIQAGLCWQASVGFWGDGTRVPVQPPVGQYDASLDIATYSVIVDAMLKGITSQENSFAADGIAVPPWRSGGGGTLPTVPLDQLVLGTGAAGYKGTTPYDLRLDPSHGVLQPADANPGTVFSIAGGDATAASNGNGGAFNLRGGNADGTGAGGPTQLAGGDGGTAGGNGGAATLAGGTAQGGNAGGGAVVVIGGAGNGTGNGGNTGVTGGTGAAGGAVALLGGNGTIGNGGTADVGGGTGGSGGRGGHANLFGGNAAGGSGGNGGQGNVTGGTGDGVGSGGAVSIAGGSGGSGVGGSGGALNMRGGNAGAGSNANGANVKMYGGTGDGISGFAGDAILAAADTSPMLSAKGDKSALAIATPLIGNVTFSDPLRFGTSAPVDLTPGGTIVLTNTEYANHNIRFFASGAAPSGAIIIQLPDADGYDKLLDFGDVDFSDVGSLILRRGGGGGGSITVTIPDEDPPINFGILVVTGNGNYINAYNLQPSA